MEKDMYQFLLACKDDICVADSVENLMKETHELGGSDVVVDRATPKVRLFRAYSFTKEQFCKKILINVFSWCIFIAYSIEMLICL